MCAAIESGSSVLVLAELGMVGDMPQHLVMRFVDTFAVATAVYKGSGKRFFVRLAEQLDIPTIEDKYDKNGEPCGERALTMDQLKDEIAENVGPETLLILPEAKRLSTGIRYWLEDLINMGVRVCCFAAANPGKDIFLEMLEIELELPTDQIIRETMRAEAERLGLQLSKSRLAELQPLAGRNPMLARKVIRNERLGLNQSASPQHTQYVVVMPIVIACLMAFGIVRFIGMGTQNKSLYIFGGTALVAGMTMKQLGQVRGARKRLGQ
ncbi:hypothetical protein IQ260_14695 [Leptolyngbya cf. ectocarpi LEGE 11479]|uniref:Uncharacterized protein n=1 Tax=Leptolyngbya cf. ectocarpi LEGE 11479 TaxID=1828722 RepID=A0A929FA35_LEPEC|nr:hypothetical protein [Leptolyngbya ectocarpi]MBE9067899.1 hypothetical protein [Leptolyngbya cf. ectocarpi LEGE 11479]